MSSFNNNNNMENLFLQTLIGRLQLRSPHQHLQTNNFPTQNFEDFLLDTNSIPDDEDEDENENKTMLAKEESKLEKEIIRIILSGGTEILKPNSGQSVTVGEHHICVGFHEEKDSDYRVWEWHGHIMLFDAENGYTPEYIYGNYFERVPFRAAGVSDEKEEEKGGSLGLRELIDGKDSINGRILHRNLNAGSPRF